MDLDTLIEKMTDRSILEAGIKQPRLAIITEALEVFSKRVITDGSMMFRRDEIPGGVDLVLAPNDQAFASIAGDELRRAKMPAQPPEVLEHMRSLYPETRLRVIFVPFDVRVIAAPVPVVMLQWYMETVSAFVALADDFKRYALAMELRAQSAH